MNILKEGHYRLMEVLEAGNAIFVAPTGYGKSKGVPLIQEELGFPRSVHALPLRSLVQSQLKFIKEGLGEDACHASGLTLPDKCSYLGGRRVVSTIDYLSLTLMRLPPPELGWILKYSLGHHEYPRANVLTSLVVLDEAHLISEPWRKEPSNGRDFLYAALEALEAMKARTLVATATLPSSDIKRMKVNLNAKVVAACKECYGNVKDVERVEPEVSSPRWVTEVEAINLESFVRQKKSEIEDEASRGKVLIVANTVPSAVRVAKELEDLSPVLVHGRLSDEDKKRAVDEIDDASVVVSTQVIEAGVDVDATWLITESAPVSSLAQRAGRLCRSRDCGEARVTVLPGSEPYGEAARRAFQEVVKARKVEWRLLDDSDSGITFLKLIERLEGKARSSRWEATFSEVITTPLPDVENIKKLLDDMCSFVRDSALIEVRAGEERVEVSLDWLSANRRKLEVRALKAVGYGEERELGPEELDYLLSRGCRGYSKILRDTGASAIVVEVSPEQYTKGWGLLAESYLR
ncbi:MAG: CRISPR-associated helicase Cas3' [Crenarchaeota archaeon]|nr:CRISPR-associated helicase Cas3' [Thermoproteota archaeon]